MRKSLVRVAITLIAINAALAIVILLGADMGDTGGRILGTSLLATGTAIVAMMQLPAASDRRLGPVPMLGIGAAVVGFVIVTVGIWSDMGSDVGWKTAGTAYTVAISAAFAALLAGIDIRGRSSWVGRATLLGIAIGATMIVLAVWVEIGGEGYWRLFAVLAVLVAAGGLAVPILSRAAPAAEQDLAVIACPFCATDLDGQRSSDAVCPVCGSRFTVRLISRAPGSGAADDDE